jgi:GTP-binding protein
VERKLYFVDLPGYGYAKISKSESEKWGAMVEGYLKNRPQLKRIFLLLDIRHEPGENDKMLFEWFLHYKLPFTIIATKSDKITRAQLQKHLAIIRRALGADEVPIPFSSETRQNRDTLWALILDNCGIDVL